MRCETVHDTRNRMVDQSAPFIRLTNWNFAGGCDVAPHPSLPCAKGGGPPIGGSEGLCSRHLRINQAFGVIALRQTIPQSASLTAPFPQGSHCPIPVTPREIPVYRSVWFLLSQGREERRNSHSGLFPSYAGSAQRVKYRSMPSAMPCTMRF